MFHKATLKIVILLLIPIVAIPLLIMAKQKKAAHTTQPALVRTETSTIKIIEEKTKPATSEKKVLQPIPTKSDVLSANKIAKPASRKVSINNEITHNMLGYKYWGIKYHPSKFVLSVNGQEIENESTKIITLNPDQTIKVHYEYEFLNGRRKGWRETIYKVAENIDKINISFDWHNKSSHLLIDNVTLISSSNKDS